MTYLIDLEHKRCCREKGSKRVEMPGQGLAGCRELYRWTMRGMTEGGSGLDDEEDWMDGRRNDRGRSWAG